MTNQVERHATESGAGQNGNLNRDALVRWYRRNRERSASLFDLLTDDAYYSRPIALRHPVVFYEGHLPAFSFNTLVKKALGGGSLDAKLEMLFARRIAPDEAAGAAGESQGQPSPTDPGHGWPHRAEVRAFAAEADARVMDAL